MPAIEVGARAPAFTLPDHTGRPVSLAQFHGSPVLIWFFSRAFGSN